MSRDSTSSELPFVRTAVQFLLKKEKMHKTKSKGRTVFSPLSLKNPSSPNVEILRSYDKLQNNRNSVLSQGNQNIKT